MKETRIKKIFDILTSDEKNFTSKEIAHILQVSSRTVRNDINELNEIFDSNGAIIESKSGIGFKFVINDLDKFENFLKNKWRKFAFLEDSFSNPEYRKKYILQTFLLQNDFIKVDDVLQEMFISRTVFNEDFKIVKLILNEYNLEFETKPYKGIKIVGSEIDRRKCLAEYVMEQPVYAASSIDFNLNSNKMLLDDIKLTLSESFDKYSYSLTHLAYQNLLIHLYVSIKRIGLGHSVEFDEENLQELKNTSEFKVANEISKELALKFFTEFSDGEIAYIATHLISKQANKSHSYESVDSEVSEILENSFAEIYRRYGIEFNTNLDLLVSLSLHISPLLERLKFKLFMKNPILENIKAYVLPYDFAIITASYIKQKYGSELSEDEIGYIALHYSTALGKRIQKVKKKIIIVCGSGKAISNLMLQRFEKTFEDSIEFIETCDVMSIYEKDLEQYDLIVTSVPIQIITEVPIVEVGVFLNSKDIKSIKPYLVERKLSERIKELFDEKLFFKDYEATNKESLLKDISSKIKEEIDVYGDLYSAIMEREFLAPTEFENLVAIPHPLHIVSKKTVVSVISLKEKIVWHKKEVQLIILLVLGSDEPEELQDFYQLMGDLLTEKLTVDRALKCKDLNGFIDLLLEGSEIGD